MGPLHRREMSRNSSKEKHERWANLTVGSEAKDWRELNGLCCKILCWKHAVRWLHLIPLKVKKRKEQRFQKVGGRLIRLWRKFLDEKIQNCCSNWCNEFKVNQLPVYYKCTSSFIFETKSIQFCFNLIIGLRFLNLTRKGFINGDADFFVPAAITPAFGRT